LIHSGKTNIVGIYEAVKSNPLRAGIVQDAKRVSDFVDAGFGTHNPPRPYGTPLHGRGFLKALLIAF
jgi:hypothetical protein